MIIANLKWEVAVHADGTRVHCTYEIGHRSFTVGHFLSLSVLAYAGDPWPYFWSTLLHLQHEVARIAY